MSKPKKGRGRPPKYVKDSQGREIVGLRLHVASGRFYDMDREGRRVYFGKELGAARARHKQWKKGQGVGNVSAEPVMAVETEGADGVALSPASRRKERLRQVQREEILEAALGLFQVKDYHSVSMREIASAVGIGTGTLYNYFENKETLFYDLIKISTQRVTEETIVPLKQAGDALSRIKGFIANYYAILVEHGTAIQFFFRIPQNLQMAVEQPGEGVMESRLLIQKSVERVIQSGIDSGVFRPLRADLVAKSLIAMIEVVSLDGSGSPSSIEEERLRVVEVLQECFLSGVKISQ